MKFKTKRKSKRCARVLITGTQKNQFIETQCKNKKFNELNYCWQHSKQNKKKAITLRGVASSQLHQSMKWYMEKYAGNEWNSKNELAMLRSLLYRTAVNINAQPWKEVIHYLPKLSLIGESISKIGERHARIEDSLKLKIEFNELQSFVSFIVGVINKHCADDTAKQLIANELQSYMERLESDDDD